MRVVLNLPSGARETFADLTLRVERDADPILEMGMPGDELWIGLKPGRYVIFVTYRGKRSMTRELVVPDAGGGDVYIQWRD